MKRYIYSWKDEIAVFFPKPIVSDLRPDDQAQALIREMKRMPKEELKKNENFSFYCLGTFDDQTGELKANIQKLFDTPKEIKDEETKDEA